MSSQQDVENTALSAKNAAPSRRQRKKADTRERIIGAAHELFLSQGYDETSMEAIAQQAGVSRRTCFRYFASKEGLAFPYRDQQLTQFQALMQQGPGGEPAYDAVKRACLALAGGFMASRDEMVVHEQLIRRHPVLRARERENDRDWQQLIVEALSRQTDSDRAQLVAGAVVGLIRTTFEMWVASNGTLNLIALVQQVFLMLDHGVPTLLST